MKTKILIHAKNPNGKGGIEHKSPEQILKSIQEKEETIQKILKTITTQIQ